MIIYYSVSSLHRSIIHIVTVSLLTMYVFMCMLVCEYMCVCAYACMYMYVGMILSLGEHQINILIQLFVCAIL